MKTVLNLCNITHSNSNKQAKKKRKKNTVKPLTSLKENKVQRTALEEYS